MAGIHYSIKPNQLKKALLHEMNLGADACLSSEEPADSHYVVLPTLDSGVKDCPWGRLRFDCHLPENCICYLYIAASNDRLSEDVFLNEQSSLMDKKRMVQSLRGLCFINKPDVLLYEISGRYLFIMMEIIGEGVRIENICADAPGDNFMQTFPEVYREKNSFFHRYLSVFSSIYNDFQEKLDDRRELLPIEEAPLPLLELYAKWLGIDVNGGYLGEKTLRALLMEAPELLRRKGTRYCIERICDILLEETPTIVERGLVQRYVRRTEEAQYNHLYGDNPYDVTLMLKNPVEEKRREQLFHLLSQFKPVRSRIHVVFLEPSGVLDEYSYLDQNAKIFTQSDGILDEAQMADGTIVLQ